MSFPAICMSSLRKCLFVCHFLIELSLQLLSCNTDHFFLSSYSLVASAAHTSVHTGPMGRWLKCRFCFTRSHVGPEYLRFPTSPRWCCRPWTHLSVKQSFIIYRGVIFFTAWKSRRKRKFGKEAGNGKCNLMTLIVNSRALLKWVAVFGSHHPYRFLLTREDILFHFREDVSGVSWVTAVVRASCSGWWYNLEAFSVLLRHWNGKDEVRNDFSGDAHSWLVELRTDLSAFPPPQRPPPRQILSPDTVLNETFTSTESCTFYSKVFAQMRSSPSEFEIFFSLKIQLNPQAVKNRNKSFRDNFSVSGNTGNFLTLGSGKSGRLRISVSQVVVLRERTVSSVGRDCGEGFIYRVNQNITRGTFS